MVRLRNIICVAQIVLVRLGEKIKETMKSHTREITTDRLYMMTKVIMAGELGRH